MSKHYQAPHRADMLPNGHPNITVLRTSRARQGWSDLAERRTEPVYTRPRRFLLKWICMALCMILLLLGLVLFWNQTVVPWWMTSITDQWNYGSHRITQVDANVGHGGESHFLAEYYHNEIVIIEVDQNTTDHIYTLHGIYGVSGTPVIQLSFEDGTLAGKPNMLVSVEGSSFGTILYNTGTAFSESEE